MYRVPDESIPRTGARQGIEVPLAVDLACPFCTRQVTFAIHAWTPADPFPVRVARAECAGCGRLPTFFWIGEPPTGEEGPPVGWTLFVHPTPASVRRPVAGLEAVEELGESLRRAYRSAVEAYNARQWVAATVLSGRALEGITRSLVPESEREETLPAQLVELLDHRDLEQPILTLADALRRSPGLAAHLDGSMEPDEEVARTTLDLLDYLVDYLFVLPDRIRRLRDRLTGSAGPPAQAPSS